MGLILCEICGISIATEEHHRFSKTELAIKLYPDYIHDHRNIQRLCNECHNNRKEKWNEKKFCEVMDIKTRSKSGRL